MEPHFKDFKVHTTIPLSSLMVRCSRLQQHKFSQLNVLATNIEVPTINVLEGHVQPTKSSRLMVIAKHARQDKGHQQTKSDVNVLKLLVALEISNSLMGHAKHVKLIQNPKETLGIEIQIRKDVLQIPVPQIR